MVSHCWRACACAARFEAGAQGPQLPPEALALRALIVLMVVYPKPAVSNS